jgi:hypothetical protein
MYGQKYPLQQYKQIIPSRLWHPASHYRLHPCRRPTGTTPGMEEVEQRMERLPRGSKRDSSGCRPQTWFTFYSEDIVNTFPVYTQARMRHSLCFVKGISCSNCCRSRPVISTHTFGHEKSFDKFQWTASLIRSSSVFHIQHSIFL